MVLTLWEGGGWRALPLLWIAMAPLGLWLLAGGLGLLPVGTRHWGGLTLTLLLTAGSGLLALPLGVLLALGRRSDLPVLRWSSTAYIELMRAVPLIAVLFFGQLLIPLFLPPGLEINRVLRAVLAFAFFAAAYIAEDVRGGLQSIPPTQREAALVLGLSPLQRCAGGVSSGAAGGSAVAHQSGGWTVAEHQPDGDSGPGGAAGNQPQPSGQSGLHRSLSGGVSLAGCGLLAGMHGDGSAGPPPGSPARSRPNQPMTVAIRATDLVKSYTPGVRALDRVSLEVSHGEVLVVMGPSGSGKSTLIRTFNGLERLDGGFLDVLGVRLDSTHAEPQVRAIRRRVGMVFQQFNLFPHLSILDNIALAPVRCRSGPRRRWSSGRWSCWRRWAFRNRRRSTQRSSVVVNSTGRDRPALARP